jgi:hypothetical protein
VIPSHGALPITQPIVVMRVAAEGGEIRLIAQEMTLGWRYRYSMLDQTLLWVDEGDTDIRRQSAWVYEWADALASLDRFPWAALRPMEVHPEFADRVLCAACERLARPALANRSELSLPRWLALCKA